MLYQRNVVKPSPLSELTGEIRVVEQQIKDNERLFNMTDDDCMVEYAIHQRSALFARHQSLLRMAKGVGNEINRETVNAGSE